MLNLNSVADLQSIIRDEISESSILEYKEKFVLRPDCPVSTKRSRKKRELAEEDKKEFAKDISAMANSNGGTVIYGIVERENEEGRKIPVRLNPIKNYEMDKDRLARLILALITPSINFNITYIADDKEDGGYFVVNIEKSDTAHQNVIDKCYYHRKDALSVKMEDYAIRDVMNRGKNPKVDLAFRLIRTKHYPINFEFELKEKESEAREKLLKEGGYSYSLAYRLVNEGQVLCKYINYFIYIPDDIIKKGNHKKEKGFTIVSGNNKTDSSLFVEAKKSMQGDVFEPLLPGMRSNEIIISLDLFDEVIDDQLYIEYEVHADNANCKRKRILFSSLECLNTEANNWKEWEENSPQLLQAIKNAIGNSQIL